MLCASRFVLNINYHQLSINYFINFFSLIFMLSFQIVAYLLVESFIKGSIQRLIRQRIQSQGCPCLGARREYGVRIAPLP